MTNGSAPFGIAAGPDGNLWFTDPGKSAIGRITPGGTITEFTTGLNPGSVPIGIAAGPDGNLWFTDGSTTTPAIGRITPGGAITEFTTGLNHGSVPAGITAGPDGNLWFTDYGTTNAIGQITPGGTITEFSFGLTLAAANRRDRGGGRRQSVVHRLWDAQGDRADHPGRDDHRVLNGLE